MAAQGRGMGEEGGGGAGGRGAKLGRVGMHCSCLECDGELLLPCQGIDLPFSRASTFRPCFPAHAHKPLNLPILVCHHVRPPPPPALASSLRLVPAQRDPSSPPPPRPTRALLSASTPPNATPPLPSPENWSAITRSSGSAAVLPCARMGSLRGGGGHGREETQGHFLERV